MEEKSNKEGQNRSQEQMVIPNFEDFKRDIEGLFQKTKSNTKGEPDDMLPNPGKEDPNTFAVSICTVDGQILQLGDHHLAFCLQSISKAINYAIALETVGKEKVEKHVGVEPGSESFKSTMVLNEDSLPHNPLITSGAIMTASLIKPDLEVDERLKFVMETWEKMMGDKEVGFKEETFNIEKENANKHFALAHLMKYKKAFPEDVDVNTVIEFYLKCCAIEVNIDGLAHAAATLANYGVCPTSGRKVFAHDTVRDTLSLMFTSGLYSHSGEFAFRVGLPAKSGIAGGMMVVVPNLLGIAIYSPRLDEHMNSVRGVEFCERLVNNFNFHQFDAIKKAVHGKKDPRQ